MADGPARRGTVSALGAAARRVEDGRFLAGKGRYVDDLAPPGAAFAHVVRSPHAHARILGIDKAAALAAPRRAGGADRGGRRARGDRRDRLRVAPGSTPRRSGPPAGTSDPRHRQGAPCRRPGRAGRGADGGSGKGRGRAAVRRLRDAARGDAWPTRWRRARREGVGRSGRQSRLPYRIGRSPRGRRAVRRGGPCLQDRLPLSARLGQRHRAARGARLSGPDRRPPHAVHQRAKPARGEGRDRRDTRHPRYEPQGDRARCRRRLRHEGPDLSGRRSWSSGPPASSDAR